MASTPCDLHTAVYLRRHQRCALSILLVAVRRGLPNVRLDGTTPLTPDLGVKPLNQLRLPNMSCSLLEGHSLHRASDPHKAQIKSNVRALLVLHEQVGPVDLRLEAAELSPLAPGATPAKWKIVD